MNEYRVTKYNPTMRNSNGGYLLDDWTCYTDIGRVFSGVTLTWERYLDVEAAYIETAIHMVQAGGRLSLTVDSLENAYELGLPIEDGDKLSASALRGIMVDLLRRRFWCRLKSDEGFIHFGDDYYMYVGCKHLPNPEVFERARQRGMYVEKFVSPYHDEEDS